MTLLTDGRIPVWLSRVSNGDACTLCGADAAARLGEDNYCAGCLEGELVSALQASKILGAIRNEPLPKVSA